MITVTVDNGKVTFCSPIGAWIMNLEMETSWDDCDFEFHEEILYPEIEYPMAA